MPTPTDLLRDDDPAPVRTLRDKGRSDFLLTADHAGRAIPRSLNRLGVSESELDRHIAWDIGIAGVTERLSAALDATAVLQTYSRLVIDCNRDPSVASSIPEVSEATNIPGNLGLSAPARAARRQAIFEPYHARIRALLDARQTAARRTVFVAMHSFTPFFKGESRAMQVGVLYNRDARLASIMLDLLRAEGDLVVGDNAPYAVSDVTDYGVPVHAREAWPVARGDRDQAGSDRGRGGSGGMGGAVCAAAAGGRCATAGVMSNAGLGREVPIDPAHAALLFIDVQNYTARPDGGEYASLTDADREARYGWFFRALRDTAVPNMQRLQTACRRAKIEVMYTVIEVVDARRSRPEPRLQDQRPVRATRFVGCEGIGRDRPDRR